MEEAKRIDPQQKLVLEVAWEALEHACIIPAQISGTRTGVFIGVSHSDHGRKLNANIMDIDSRVGPHHYHCFVPNRLSYFLNLQGPSIAIDTACSSSLVAIHLACQSLRLGESVLALAGGVNMHLLPEESIYASLAGYLSQDGRCKSFNEKADGFARSEGCGIVVLKLLTNAIKDQDNILALIRGSAVNHNGLSNGITAPNTLSQKALIKNALANAAILPKQVSYVEAHGTGTSKGDSFEVEALQSVLKQDRALDEKCLIGSSKANIGHLEAASGIASFIKVVLALQQQEIPPQLHLTQLNRYIKLEGTPFSIPTEKQSWPIKAGSSRIAAINALGFGGSNCHMIIEEATLKKASNKMDESSPAYHLLTLSAKNEEALRELVERYHAFLSTNPTTNLSDLCYTAHSCRSSFNFVASFICDSVSTLRQQLLAYISDNKRPDLISGKKKRGQQLVFVFGSELHNQEALFNELYLSQPYFKELNDRALQYLKSIGKDLSLLPAQQDIHTFISQYAFASLLKYWGITADNLIGYGIGEYALCCFKGIWSFEECLNLLASRANRLQTESTPSSFSDELDKLGDYVYLEMANNQFLQAANNEQEKGWIYLLTTLAHLILLDIDINWIHFYNAPRSPISELPTYPFQKQFCWYELPASKEEQAL